MNPNSIVVAIIAAVFTWRIYNRVRRSIGRQPLQPKRLMARVIIFAVIALVLLVFSWRNSNLLMGLGAGLVLGVLAALAGLKLTQFETTPEGKFYTPNKYFGGALAILLVGRLVYRLMVLSNLSNNSAPPPAFLQSALSLLVFGLLAGYYVAYYSGVLARSRTTAAVP
jgi:membrane protein CcdC involved in cytochrome C biogenesis